MKSCLIVLAIYAASCSAYGAGLSLTLTPANLSGVAGPDPLTFTALLVDTDNDLSFMYLNDISVTFNAPGNLYLSKDPTGDPVSTPDTFFFNDTTNGTLIGDTDPVDNSYTGPLFHVYIAPNTPEGLYTGMISILGGYVGNTDMNVLATQPFQVTVTPEPATAGLMLVILAGGGVAARRRHWQ